jgi:hypothetical protein
MPSRADWSFWHSSVEMFPITSPTAFEMGETHPELGIRILLISTCVSQNFRHDEGTARSLSLQAASGTSVGKDHRCVCPSFPK